MTTTSNPASAPLRGTQSLVGVMTFVWKHPSLTALELLWRWLVGLPLLWLLWHSLGPVIQSTPLDTTALQSMTFFEPVRSVAVLARQISAFLPAVEHIAKWWLPTALILWTGTAALGRSAILRRADPSLHPRPGAMALFSLLRGVCFFGLLTLWALAIVAAVRHTVSVPAQQGGEPNLVLLTAEAVAITLLAFLLWSAAVWVLDLAPIRTMTQSAPQTPETRKQLRSKLIETNLVMGIVRVILLVLSLTFSASPLPFQSRETQAYINVWWAATALFYILGSDFFHVVRRVTYLRLLQSIARQTNANAPGAS